MRKNPVLVLGLGNELKSDDAIGLQVVRRLAERAIPGVDIVESPEMGLSLLDHFVGYERIYLVDSIMTHRHPPGTLLEFDQTSLPTIEGASPHYIGVGELLKMGKNMDLPMPKETKIFAIEVFDPYTVGTHIHERVAKTAEELVVKLANHLNGI